MIDKFLQTPPEKRRQFIRTLVDLDLDVNYSPHPGVTALYIACKYYNSVAVIQELLSLGAMVNLSVNGMRPIDFVFLRDDKHIVSQGNEHPRNVT